MAKRKGRADRKKQREKATKAHERGLPSAAPAPKPAKTRKVKGDVTAAAIASEEEGRSAPAKSEVNSEPEAGMPTVAKVGLAAAGILVLFWGLSMMRKNDAQQANADTSSSSTVIPGEVSSSAVSADSPSEAESVTVDEGSNALDDSTLDAELTPSEANSHEAKGQLVEKETTEPSIEASRPVPKPAPVVAPASKPSVPPIKPAAAPSPPPIAAPAPSLAPVTAPNPKPAPQPAPAPAAPTAPVPTPAPAPAAPVPVPAPAE